jgi:hypothetical protein
VLREQRAAQLRAHAAAGEVDRAPRKAVLRQGCRERAHVEAVADFDVVHDAAVVPSRRTSRAGLALAIAATTCCARPSGTVRFAHRCTSTSTSIRQSIRSSGMSSRRYSVSAASGYSPPIIDTTTGPDGT